jgi:hypothetical protein
MESPFDIFRAEDEGSLLWRGSAASLDEAKARILELAQSCPAEYVIVNLQSGLRVSVAATGGNTSNNGQLQSTSASEC